MTDHTKYIDGSFYEDAYTRRDGVYAHMYGRENPEWAKQCDLFHTGLIMSWLGLVPAKHRVLDLGSGVGRYLDAWEARGFWAEGIEISPEAVRKSKRTNVVVGSAANLPWRDNKFTVAASAAFMEHVAPEITAQVLRESVRVAKYSAHIIPVEPSEYDAEFGHIHIQSAEDWVDEIMEALGSAYSVCVIANDLTPEQPLFLITPANDTPFTLEQFAKNVESRSDDEA